MKYLAGALIILSAAGCQDFGGGLAEPIRLPNGANGWIVDCAFGGMTSCFKSAGSKCKNGYLIHERTSDKNTESKIELEGLAQAGSSGRSLVVDQPSGTVDKYMVISCKE